MSCIYLIKNRLNHKSYVGQTIQDPEKRWKQHIKASRSKKRKSLLHKAIDKYGAENFSFNVIAEGNFTRIQLIELEAQYISDLESLAPNGYNLLAKGGYAKEKFNSEKTRAKLSKAIKEKWRDDEYRQKVISKRAKAQTGIKKNKSQPLIRKDISIEQVVKLYQDGYKHPEICKKLGLSRSAVKVRLRRGEVKLRAKNKHLTKKQVSTIKRDWLGFSGSKADFARKWELPYWKISDIVREITWKNVEPRINTE